MDKADLLRVELHQDVQTIPHLLFQAPAAALVQQRAHTPETALFQVIGEILALQQGEPQLGLGLCIAEPCRPEPQLHAGFSAFPQPIVKVDVKHPELVHAPRVALLNPFFQIGSGPVQVLFGIRIKQQHRIEITAVRLIVQVRRHLVISHRPGRVFGDVLALLIQNADINQPPKILVCVCTVNLMGEEDIPAGIFRNRKPLCHDVLLGLQ